jgi:hypothetical protein
MDVSPNVINEEMLRGLLAEGYEIEVICTGSAEKRTNTWYGRWVIRAVLPDGSSPKALVTSRTQFKQREIKTIVGLVSFLSDMGCKTACIPLEQGATQRHVVPGRGKA